jgi:hypothetical protein
VLGRPIRGERDDAGQTPVRLEVLGDPRRGSVRREYRPADEAIGQQVIKLTTSWAMTPTPLPVTLVAGIMASMANSQPLPSE